MRTVQWIGIHIQCSMPAVFNARSRLSETVFPLRQSCKSGRAERGLSISKYFGPISGLHTKLFYDIKSNDFFLSWRKFVVPTAELLWVKWFLQRIPFANTAAFFCFLLGLASNSFCEGNSGEEISAGWLCVEKINHSRDVWLVLKTMAHKPTFHAYSTILYSLFYAYSAIVDSFVIVSFFWETLHSAVLSLTNKISLCFFKPMFWSRCLLFWVW